MTTALQIIERAYRTIGVLASGETATAELANDGLVYLNDLLQGLSNESLAVYTDVLDTLPLDGSTSYTFGLTGDINTARPVSVVNVYFRDTNNIDYPVTQITSDQYDSLYSKTLSTGIPEYIYIAPDYPLMSLYPWPLSSTGTLHISSKKLITSFSGLTDTVSLPNGYERMLRYQLAVEMMAEYGVQNPQVMAMAADAKAYIKRVNYSPSVLSVNLPFGSSVGNGSGRRILSDGV